MARSAYRLSGEVGNGRRSRLLAHVPERDFLQQVKDLAGFSGWLAYHTLDSRGSDQGFPDLVLIRGGRVVFAELKSEAGKPSQVQARWLLGLAIAGAEVYLWRPRNWSQIEAVLSRG